MKVYAGPDLALVGHLKNVLDSHGIASDIRGLARGVGVGELPPIEAWPELWVQDESQGEEAMRLLKDALKPSEHETEPWTCAECGEELEGQFTVCWKCGTNRPETEGI